MSIPASSVFLTVVEEVDQLVLGGFAERGLETEREGAEETDKTQR